MSDQILLRKIIAEFNEFAELVQNDIRDHLSYIYVQKVKGIIANHDIDSNDNVDMDDTDTFYMSDWYILYVNIKI